MAAAKDCPESNGTKKKVAKEPDLAQKYGSNGQLITTLMIRNIPAEYTQDMMLQEVIKSLGGAELDFFYLPWDTQRNANAGYAFVNFCSPGEARKCIRVFTNHKFKKFQNQKLGKVSPAHIQGLENNLLHFQDRAVVQGHSPNGPLVIWKGQQIELGRLFAELEGKKQADRFDQLQQNLNLQRAAASEAAANAAQAEHQQMFGSEVPRNLAGVTTKLSNLQQRHQGLHPAARAPASMPGYTTHPNGQRDNMALRIDENAHYSLAAVGTPLGALAENLFAQDDDGSAMFSPASSHRLTAPMSAPPGLLTQRHAAGYTQHIRGPFSDVSVSDCQELLHVDDCTFDATKGAPLFDIASSCPPVESLDMAAAQQPSVVAPPRFSFDDDGAILYDMRGAEQRVFSQMLANFGM